jgi:2,3-bisphosphoglycerate-dependent phosphoglycerate mutase
MPKLILLRHFKSQWNLENRFTGWTDVPICREGREKVPEVAEKLAGKKIDIAYTSPLIRNLESCLLVISKRDKYPIFRHFSGKMKKWGEFSELERNYIPVFVSEALNERYYGDLQGLNKKETMEKYGEEQVRLWRRGYKNNPPGGESLEDVVRRVRPFQKNFIERDLEEGKDVLVVASHNSLRALIKEIEKISDEDIINVEVPYAGIIEYEYQGGVYKKTDSY